MKTSTKTAKTGLIVSVLSVVMANFPTQMLAQCQMCRTALTNSVEGQRWAHGINQAILLLIAAPFLIAAGIVFSIYRPRINNRLAEIRIEVCDIVTRFFGRHESKACLTSLKRDG